MSQLQTFPPCKQPVEGVSSTPSILGHTETVSSLLLSRRGSRMLKEVWRSVQGFLPFPPCNNRSTHRMRRALLMEGRRLHSYCLRGAGHQGSGLKATIQLLSGATQACPDSCCCGKPSLISAEAQHVSPALP